jgi:hypothetical protein
MDQFEKYSTFIYSLNILINYYTKETLRIDFSGKILVNPTADILLRLFFPYSVVMVEDK